MIVSTTLLKDLQKRVTLLEEDLRRRCDGDPHVNSPLHSQYEAARQSRRTAEPFNAWRDEQLTQIAVAWVLACVFVRFLENNQLLDTPFLAGPDPARMNRARDEQELFFKQNPTASERDYLLHGFGAVGQLPGMRQFFDRRHNPLWLAGPTGDALAALLDFWRKTNPDTGALAHDFTDPGWNTRFLGDLYQDLSEFARKRYALLQTPELVEQFILDRTLTPAIDTFGYRVVRMLDLTCGSGHFLFGGFDRLYRLWQEHEPGENPRVLAQRALDQVCGVDLNPNVIAIARFRLLLAALKVCGPQPDGRPSALRAAPDFKINLAVGDSLLHGARFHLEEKQARQQTFGGDEIFRDELQHFYETEDREALHRILGRQYHVVVGNPPYITVKDKALNQLYRDRFDSCRRKYSLAAPFMERFFDLAIPGEPAMKWDPFASQRSQTDPGQPRAPGSELRSPSPAGYVGMITSNSFMNSSSGCFWLKQTCFPRGGAGIGRGIQDEAWEGRFASDGTKLKQFPIPTERPLALARDLDGLARGLQACIPTAALGRLERYFSHREIDEASARGWAAAAEEFLQERAVTDRAAVRPLLVGLDSLLEQTRVTSLARFSRFSPSCSEEQWGLCTDGDYVWAAA
jgi:SAM-dependent methyltransferase